MTEDEWNAICLHIELCWKSREDEEFDDLRRSAYHTFLGELDAGTVMLALKRLVQDGTIFRPTPGEIMAAVNNDPGVPTFAEAFSRVRRALSAGGDDDAILRRLEDEHRYVRAWVDRYGAHRLAMEPTDDPKYGGATMHRLERDYQEFCRVALDRERQGRTLLSAGVTNGSLSKFQPLASLGAERKELESGK